MSEGMPEIGRERERQEIKDESRDESEDMPVGGDRRRRWLPFATTTTDTHEIRGHHQLSHRSTHARSKRPQRVHMMTIEIDSAARGLLPSCPTTGVDGIQVHRQPVDAHRVLHAWPNASQIQCAKQPVYLGRPHSIGASVERGRGRSSVPAPTHRQLRGDAWPSSREETHGIHFITSFN